ncbi:hypothetical protein CIN_04690 [Commensalibacter intestini A911]|uniref:YCII-related domain-containing protein n=2 Tax=Commensalibacter intestini TaxID=479936 RepID=A0A251ZW04_9PROT|nr:YciI family protein [Commensalibacter intestini]EHD14537.1 hypothetical protein CIN_04690 [Commensalibacter intestini A911]OUI78850.1 hypothetical protein HK18_05460 [Commensalibacter intestini]
MLFAIMCTDKPDCLELRTAVRPEHLAYLKTYEQYIKIVGPLLGGNEKSCGSLIIVEVEDRAAAAGFAESDPYAKAGLFESVVIRPFKMVGFEGKILGL